MDINELPGWAGALIFALLLGAFFFAFRKSHPRIETRQTGNDPEGVWFELAVDNLTEVPVHATAIVPILPWRTALATEGTDGFAGEPMRALRFDEWMEPKAVWKTNFKVLAPPEDRAGSVLLACQIGTKCFMHNRRTRWVRLAMSPQGPTRVSRARL